MRLIGIDDAPVHSANMPGSPLVTVLFGGHGDAEKADVGMVRVMVPPGAGMPAHRHNGSDVILTLRRGSIRVTTGDGSVDVTTGDALLIHKDEAVALSNPHQDTAELIVAAGPAAFVSTVSRWPLAATTGTTPPRG